MAKPEVLSHQKPQSMQWRLSKQKIRRNSPLHQDTGHMLRGKAEYKAGGLDQHAQVSKKKRYRNLRFGHYQDWLGWTEVENEESFSYLNDQLDQDGKY